MQEQATFWRDPELGNLEVMHATYLTHSFAPHRHASFAISVIDRGVGTLWYRGANHIAPAGSLGILNPDEIHTGSVYGTEWTYRVFYPSIDFLRHIGDSMMERNIQMYLSPVPIVTDPALATLVRRLHTVLKEKCSLLERESELLNTYSYLFTHYAERPLTLHPIGKESHAVQIARDYIEANFASTVSLAQLAQTTGLSPYHLVHVFRQTMGLPPHAYLNQIRLERAKQLLLMGRSIATVAYETGFTDQSHLTKRFKQIYGVTPGHILQNLPCSIRSSQSS